MVWSFSVKDLHSSPSFGRSFRIYLILYWHTNLTTGVDYRMQNQNDYKLSHEELKFLDQCMINDFVIKLNLYFKSSYHKFCYFNRKKMQPDLFHVWYLRGIFEYMQTRVAVNHFPNNPWFLFVCKTSLLKTLWEKESLAISPFPAVFYIHFENSLPFSSNLKLSANSSVWNSLKFAIWERAKLQSKLFGSINLS